MSEVTDDQLRAWDEAACKATPGPWESLPIEASYDPKLQSSFVRTGNLENASRLHIAAKLSAADAGFVAIAREAVPTLIHELVQLRQIHRSLVKAVAEDRSRRVLVAQLAAQTVAGAIRWTGDQPLPPDRVAGDAVELAEAICKRLGL